MDFKGHVIVGITGGIAAYKVCDLIRLFVKDGYRVHPVMTAGAKKFITPLTVSYLAANKVHDEIFSHEKISWDVEHIALADQADAMIIAPATANIIAKIAHGISDDMLSLTALAFAGDGLKPLIIAPAMNFRMYNHDATQNNLKTLKDRGVQIIEPETGNLACGEQGQGRLASIDLIFAESIEALQKKKQLDGVKVVVTAGGTKEPIDPVRVISNRSSGKMGYAIANEFKRRGATVTLISSADLPVPNVDNKIGFETAAQLKEKLAKVFDDCDVLIMAAAVSDFTVDSYSDSKINRASGDLTLKLVPTDDILAGLALKKKEQFIVGFAAESENLIENAKSKLTKKRIDMIVANDISRDDIAFNSDCNEVILISENEQEILEKSPKSEIARKLVDKIANEMRKTK